MKTRRAQVTAAGDDAISLCYVCVLRRFTHTEVYNCDIGTAPRAEHLGSSDRRSHDTKCISSPHQIDLQPKDAITMAEPYNEEIMRVFGFWTGVLTLKLMGMSLLTARTRFRKRVFANHEDAMMLKKARVAYDDEDVERVRRSHLNDLENILPWVAITYVYLGTGPSNWIASLIIRGFVLSRIGHTLSYAVFSKQPFRAIFFFIGYALTAFEAISTMLHYF